MRITDLTARIRSALLDMPVLVKVMGIALGMAVFLGSSLIWQLRHAYLELEVGEVEDYAHMIASTLATGAAPLLRNDDRAGAQRLLDDMAREVPSINAIEMRDSQGRLLAHVPATKPEARLIRGTAVGIGGLPASVSVAVNDSHVNFEIGWHTRRLIGMTALIGFFGLLATWWLMRVVTRPVHELVEVTRSIKTGNYDARATIRAKDEVGELAAAFNDMMGALQQKHAVNRQLLRKLIAAEEEERKRIARELHDHTGQALTSIIASLAALKNGKHNKELNQLLDMAAQALSEVHNLSRTLRPSALDEAGLVPALQRLCEGMAQQLGLKVNFSAIGWEVSARLPHEIEVALYRIGQEALTNAVRHGRAPSVEVLLHRKPASVLVVVDDDGQGFDVSDWRGQSLRGGHAGLLGIEERAALLGGTLRLESKPGGGTSLFVDIPLTERPHG
ncbi:MAG: HAMP domain-containing protein [Verrucomicrobia bacterium]|nr:HAMP domain-containing protein [Verrucomicrobiota bacterium]